MERLLDSTRRLLRQCDLGSTELARRSAVPYQWLVKFRRGEIDNPGVLVCQQLHDWLELYRDARANKGGTANSEAERGASASIE
jgi:hypothetical protein